MRAAVLGNAHSVAKHAREAEELAARLDSLESDPEALRLAMRAHRQAARMPLRRLAQEVDVSRSYFAAMELGQRPYPRAVALLAIEAVRRYKDLNWI